VIGLVCGSLPIYVYVNVMYDKEFIIVWIFIIRRYNNNC
jgi:hypothetical protein